MHKHVPLAIAHLSAKAASVILVSHTLGWQMKPVLAPNYTTTTILLTMIIIVSPVSLTVVLLVITH